MSAMRRSGGDPSEERHLDRHEEPTKSTDPERAVTAASIATEGQARRAEADLQDRGKALREWIAVVLLGLAIVLLGATMVGVYWQVREVIALSGPIRDQAEAAKKTAEAAVRQSEATEQSLLAVHRAWIAPRLAYFLAEPVAGKPVEMWIEYRNTGHEPADVVVGEVKTLAMRPSELDDGSKAQSKMSALSEQFQNSSQL